MMEIKYIEVLLEIGEEMHPHLGQENHTNKLIKKLIEDRTKLSRSECFDLGKYYQRMLEIVDKNEKEINDEINVSKKLELNFKYRHRLHAVLELKWAM